MSLAARTVATPLGPMVLAASPRGLALCEFLDGRSARERVAEVPARAGDDPPGAAVAGRLHLDRAAHELAAYFRGTLTRFTVPLDLRGGAFETTVWRALLDVPYGRTESYGALAKRIGKPGGARAVGLANGRNPVAIVVPCHRVVGSDGRLVGYGGGLNRKKALLDLEGGLAFHL
jgi:O-6-methylguanine DNA methyltransferase